jgi:Sulfotransferase family
MGFPPQLFIIGAQRSGTTSLSALLDQHPAVVLSAPKESDFFSVNFAQGLDWYRARFRRLDATLIDASVSYTMAQLVSTSSELPDGVPRLIRAVSPRARFIYLVRDPAERCHSAYWHDVRAGRERRSLREAIEQSAYYTMASYYHRQITPFLRHFPLDRFLILRFEDFAKQPLAIARKCIRFAGLDDSGISLQPETRNQSFLYNGFGQKLRQVLGEDRMMKVSRVASTTLPSGLHPLAKRLVSHAVPELAPDDRARLHRHFAQDAEAFARLTGMQVIAKPVAA